MRTRGFLLGGTSGRTTLNGEGLQHQDGHGHLLFSVVPSCVAYDPCYAYELVVILQDGLRRMYAEDEQVFYYITVMNENYSHPAHAGGRRGGDPPRACTCCAPAPRARKHRVQLLGSGTILREVEAAADPARGAVRRRRRRLERHQLQRAAARRPRRRSLEPAASEAEAAHARTSPICCAAARARSSRRPTT